VKIFKLRKADALSMANLLQQLFLGTSGIGTTTTTAGPGPGFPAAPAGPAGPAGAATNRPLQLTLGGATPEGPPLLDLRVTIDNRTNSLIVAGSEANVLIIESMIYQLDASLEADLDRRNEVYHLRNATATDVANSLTTFYTNELTIRRNDNELPPFQDYLREVVVVPEPITNKLLISATPRFYPEVLRLIEELDADSPQVVIQVLIAEVDLNNTDEFGVEIGLQTPVLFQRSITPANGFFGAGTVSYANAVGGLVPPGVTVASTVNPASQPGFNFNNPALPLGNNPVVAPTLIGYQGLNSLGVGRVSPLNPNISGFVFSAASDSFNLLIRALKTQGRADILSRPQITTLDNQSARVFAGQNFPIVLGSTVTATGLVTNNITYTPVGVELIVTPRITPDGRVLMRVTPQISSTATTNVSLGNGITATAINQQLVDTTVVAVDGETVALGGLISKKDQKSENKIPWLGDLPAVGAAFRYRTQQKNKTEFLVIMTPHIVHNRFQADQILAEESRRMDWVLGDVVRQHGTTGLEPIYPPPCAGDAGVAPAPLFAPSGPLMDGATPPAPSAPPMGPAGSLPSMTPSGPSALPQPTPTSSPAPGAAGAAMSGYRTTPPTIVPAAASVPVHYNPPQPTLPAVPPAPVGPAPTPATGPVLPPPGPVLPPPPGPAYPTPTGPALPPLPLRNS
jgi:type II secretion system protein D